MLTFCDPLSLCCECLLTVTRDFYFGRSSPRFPSVRCALYSGTHFFFYRVRRGYYELQRFTFQFWNYSKSDSTSSNDTDNFLRKSLCSSMTQEKDSRIKERKKVVNAINRDFGETVASLSNLFCCFPFAFFCLWREGSNVFPFSLGNTKRMLCSDWLSKLGHSCPLEIARSKLPALIPCKKNIAWSELTNFVNFGQCRRWSRKKRLKVVRTEKK